MQILRGSSVSFYIDSLLMRLVYGKPVVLKVDKQMREDVLALLDMLVDSGSSTAYMMRDDFVTPLPRADLALSFLYPFGIEGDAPAWCVGYGDFSVVYS